MATNNKAPKAGDKPAAAQNVEKPTVHRVIATKKGYYGEQLRPVGMIFNIKVKKGEKWPSWVEPFDDEAPAKAAVAPSEPDAQSTDSSDDVI